MVSTRWTLPVALAGLCVGFTAIAPPSSPHAMASLCLAGADSDDVEMDCTDVCALCHQGATGPTDFYDVGDAGICGACHADKTADTRAAQDLLATAEHGNHPVAVAYQSTNLRSMLAAQPRGPKLFTDADGGGPRMYCSTCHDPHSTRHRLLRTEGEICRTCHVM